MRSLGIRSYAHEKFGADSSHLEHGVFREPYALPGVLRGMHQLHRFRISFLLIPSARKVRNALLKRRNNVIA